MYKSRLRNSKDRVEKQIKKDKFQMEDGYEYGFVKQMMGNGRCIIHCEDGKERLGRIRGSMRKYRAKVIITTHDLVAVTRREYEDDKVDVIHKFSHEESSHLLNKGKLPEKIARTIEKEQMLNGHGHSNTNNLDHIVFDHETCDDDDDEDGDGAGSNGSIDLDEI